MLAVENEPDRVDQGSVEIEEGGLQSRHGMEASSRLLHHGSAAGTKQDEPYEPRLDALPLGSTLRKLWNQPLELRVG
jgi:hypothetical protein